MCLPTLFNKQNFGMLNILFHSQFSCLQFPNNQENLQSFCRCMCMSTMFDFQWIFWWVFFLTSDFKSLHDNDAKWINFLSIRGSNLQYWWFHISVKIGIFVLQTLIKSSFAEIFSLLYRKNHKWQMIWLKQNFNSHSPSLAEYHNKHIS